MKTNAKVAMLHQSVSKIPSPPVHLSASSKKWWSSVVAEYVMSDSDLKILTLAAETLDAAEDARRILAKEGSTFTDNKGSIKMHPAVLIYRDSKSLAGRLIAQLRLDMPPARAPGRPGSYPHATPTPGRG